MKCVTHKIATKEQQRSSVMWNFLESRIKMKKRNVSQHAVLPTKWPVNTSEVGLSQLLPFVLHIQLAALKWPRRIGRQPLRFTDMCVVK